MEKKVEEIDEGKVKSTATTTFCDSSNATKPNDNQPLVSSNKEEGELSDSDDDDDNERPVSSGAPFAGDIALSSGPAEVALMAKTAAGNSTASSIDIHSWGHAQPVNHKGVEKNRAPFTGSPGWNPNSSNSNLVISFSDDDSGSESEGFTREKPAEVKSIAAVAKKSGKPPVSLTKTNPLQETAKNVSKVRPEKSTSHPTNLSSRLKGRIGVNSRTIGAFAFEQGSGIRNCNILLNKSLGNQERGINQDVGWRNNQLQDLRQQIALRESELKLKASQQNNDVARNYQPTSALVAQLELKEPETKRIKVGGSFTNPPTSDGPQELATLQSLLRNKASEKNSLPDRNIVDRGLKKFPISLVDSSIAKLHKQASKHIDVTPEHLPNALKYVADISSSCNQIEKNARRMDPCVVFSQTVPQGNVVSTPSQKNSDGLASNHSRRVGEYHHSGNKASRKHNGTYNIDHREAISGDKTSMPSPNNLNQGNNAGMWNHLDDVNISGHSNRDIQAVFEMEEFLDKELEKAQDHRHMCEIEERNALKAYRKAQRALIEANSRCSKLYYKRELCSARFRTYIMEDSNLLWSSKTHELTANQLDLPNHRSQNIDLIPMTNQPMQPCYDDFNQQFYDSCIQRINDGPLTVSNQHANRQNLEVCSEPDASTSEPLPHKSKDALNRLSSQSNELNVSVDEDEETFPLVHESVEPNCEYQQRKQVSDGRQGTVNESIQKLSIDSTEDPLVLEAALRSQLVARLGKRTLSKNSDSYNNVDHQVEPRQDDDIGTDKMQMSNGRVSASEGHNNQLEVGGTDKQEGSIQTTSIQVEVHDQCCSEVNSSKAHSTAEFPLGLNCSVSELLSSPLVFRSVYDHLKVGSSITVTDQTTMQENHKIAICVEESACVNSDETQYSWLIANSEREAAKVCFGSRIGSYTCNVAVDPFWPICMYELRGKCNNDECPWQHFKMFSQESRFLHPHDDSDNFGGLPRDQRNSDSATKLSKFQNILTPPVYIISLDMLKADSHAIESVVARRNGQCWQKCFSVSLALASMFRKDLPNEFLQPSDGRIEVHNDWNGQSSYFQSRNGVMNQLKQASLDKVYSLETALLVINQATSKAEGVKKALSVLSRALEADRTSESLWIIYLLIYCSSIKSVGKDDMFSHGVENNERSYVLWLMYINSRVHLDDRFVSYEAALSALCRHASASDGNNLNASACILDLFLQMMECFCMSGNIEKAIQRVPGFFFASPDTDKHYSSLLSDILLCLTFSDKLMLWVCCIYLFIYRKLPAAVVQQFECEKELLSIEWPSVHLVDDEKQRVLKMVETVVDFVESGISNESRDSVINLRLRQHFAICHIRCMVAIDGLECSRDPLNKYIKLYPSCLELILVSARMQKYDVGNSNFVGFEEALIKWPPEVPGIQCIWNQYAEDAIRSERTSFAKELMDRWFHSVWKVKFPYSASNVRCSDISHGSPKSTLTSNSDSTVLDKSQMDAIFGLLNLSLYHILQDDRNEAWLAIDKALKFAGPEIFKHCVREHAMFLQANESRSKEDAHISWQLNLLSQYLDIYQSLPQSELLTRLFIDKIEKPRVQQLVRNLLSPISSDHSLVNLVLEIWYGPSLIPQNFKKLKDLVDFVEAILEIVPSNYPLAYSVCKLLSRDHNPADVNSASLLFWASSNLVSALCHAVPIAPEYSWVEAAAILGDITGVESISERFYNRALSVYPFSIRLWKSYHRLSESRGDTSKVDEAAKEKGIELG